MLNHSNNPIKINIYRSINGRWFMHLYCCASCLEDNERCMIVSACIISSKWERSTWSVSVAKTRGSHRIHKQSDMWNRWKSGLLWDMEGFLSALKIDYRLCHRLVRFFEESIIFLKPSRQLAQQSINNLLFINKLLSLLEFFINV